MSPMSDSAHILVAVAPHGPTPAVAGPSVCAASSPTRPRVQGGTCRRSRSVPLLDGQLQRRRDDSDAGGLALDVMQHTPSRDASRPPVPRARSSASDVVRVSEARHRPQLPRLWPPGPKGPSGKGETLDPCRQAPTRWPAPHPRGQGWALPFARGARMTLAARAPAWEPRSTPGQGHSVIQIVRTAPGAGVAPQTTLRGARSSRDHLGPGFKAGLAICPFHRVACSTACFTCNRFVAVPRATPCPAPSAQAVRVPSSPHERLLPAPAVPVFHVEQDPLDVVHDPPPSRPG